MARVYYNEIDAYCARWLYQLMRTGQIPKGDIDTRSIEDVRPDDLRDYDQCHFFAGLGGWAYAWRLAGWGDRPGWTGSCPCQPFSAAGKGAGVTDQRHLWPAWFHLIAQCRPPIVFGEQVAAAVGHAWLDGVCADLEGQDYAIGVAVLPACAVGAPHRRDRLWFVADTIGERGTRPATSQEPTGINESCKRGAMANSSGERSPHRNGSAIQGLDEPRRQAVELERRSGGNVVNTHCNGWQSRISSGSFARHWHPADSAGCSTVIGHDGKARRVEPGIRLLAHGVPARVGRLRAYGNAIVPQVATEFVGAYLDATR